MYPVANRARTCPSKASVKQARKTHFFPAVVSGFVDQGEIMGIFPSSATCAAGIAPTLAFGPTIANTLSSEARRFRASPASAAVPLLSSMTSRSRYAFPATFTPPASLISATAISAAFLHEAPMAGMSPLSSAITPIARSGSSFVPQAPKSATPESRRKRKAKCLLIGRSSRGTSDTLSEKSNLGCQFDAEPVFHGLLHLFHQRRDVRRRRSADVHEHVRVNGRDLGASDAAALQPAFLEQFPREETRRVLENRTGIWLRRQGVLSLRGHLRHSRRDRGGWFGREAEGSPGHDAVGVRERRPPVAVCDLGRRRRARFPIARDEIDRHEDVEQLRAVGPGVDAHGPAERRRNAGQVLEAGEARPLRSGGERHERHPAARHDLRRLDSRREEVAREREHDSGESRVGNEEVRPLPESENGQSRGATRAEERREAPRVWGFHKTRGRPADPERRPAGKRDVLAHDRAHAGEGAFDHRTRRTTAPARAPAAAAPRMAFMITLHAPATRSSAPIGPGFQTSRTRKRANTPNTAPIRMSVASGGTSA